METLTTKVKKGGKAMKKILAVLGVAVLVLSFLPKAEAGETATLGLRVTFDLVPLEKIREFVEALERDPLNLVDRDGVKTIDQLDLNRAEEGYGLALEYVDRLPVDMLLVLDQNRDGEVDRDDLTFVHGRIKEAIYDIEDIRKLAAMLDAGSLDFNGDGYIDDIDQNVATARYQRAFELAQYLDQETLYILDRDADGEINVRDRIIVCDMVYSVHWIIVIADLLERDRLDLNGDGEITEADVEVAIKHYEMAFELLRYLPGNTFSILDQNDDGLINEIDLKIVIERIRDAMPTISIEVTPGEWILDNVRLGEKRENLDPDAVPIHSVRNTGNVSVLVSMGYGPTIASGIRPGPEQGLDTFITEVYREGFDEPVVLPIDSGIKFAVIGPDEKAPLHMVYGAPTAISDNSQQHGIGYEFKAYPDIIRPLGE